MKHKDWVKTLKSDPMTDGYRKERGIEIEKAKQEMLNDISSGTVAIAHGVFGPETEDSDAYVNTMAINPPSGGTYTKVYGCSYMFKGAAPAFLVKGMQMPKYIFSGFLRDIMFPNFIVLMGWGYEFLFRRRRFLKRLRWFMYEFGLRATDNYQIKPEDCYNDLEKEIERAMIQATEGEGLWGEILREFTRFFKIVLFMDNAYRYPVQDGLSNVKGGGIKEFWRIFDLMASRESDSGMVKKVKFIRKGVRIMLWTSPALTRILGKFMDELNSEKIKMDEADHYFSLRFKSYNIDGRTFEDREAEWHRINKEKGHVFMI